MATSKTDLQARVIELECRISFLEEELAAATAALAAQALESTRLSARVEALAETLRAKGAGGSLPFEDETPPHY